MKEYFEKTRPHLRDVTDDLIKNLLSGKNTPDNET